MIFEKGGLAVVTVVGVAFVGLVGYKILKKKSPEMSNKAKESVINVRKRTSEILEGAKRSFREGYANT